jgi:hypothetical protein
MAATFQTSTTVKYAQSFSPLLSNAAVLLIDPDGHIVGEKIVSNKYTSQGQYIKS